MNIINKDPYRVGLLKKLSEKDIQTLVDTFAAEPQEEPGILGGRGKITKTVLENNLPVVVKYYKRGGFLRHFIKQSYLRAGKTRSQIEFEMLKKARDLGISVPEPIAWASCGSLFYKGWLVTKEIKDNISLADYCLAEPSDINEVLSMATDQVKLLIQNKIIHLDLHPGNILFDGKNVFVIDFDKSKTANHNEKYFIDFYIERWKRAVKKHRLPEKTATIFEETLMSDSL